MNLFTKRAKTGQNCAFQRDTDLKIEESMYTQQLKVCTHNMPKRVYILAKSVCTYYLRKWRNMVECTHSNKRNEVRNDMRKEMSEERRQYLKEYKKGLKRIPLEVDYDFYIKVQQTAYLNGQSVNGFIKSVLAKAVEPEALEEPADINTRFKAKLKTINS